MPNNIDDLLDRAFGIKKELPILTPPKPPKIIETYQEEIDFEKIANSSEFKRLIYMIYTGKTHRGNRQNLDNEIKSHKENNALINVIKHDSSLIKEIKSNPLYIKQALKNNR